MKEQIMSNPQSSGSHAGVRSNSSEYHDGANVTDQLGNDDQNQNFGTFDSDHDEMLSENEDKEIKALP